MKKVITLLILCFSFLSIEAKAQEFLSLSGEKITYEALIQKPKTVIFAWAIWCPYCRKELERLNGECKNLGEVEVFFVNLGDKKSAVEKYADSKKFESCIREKIILDQNYFTARKFNIVGIPTYIFLKNGEVVQTSHFFSQELLTSIFGEE